VVASLTIRADGRVEQATLEALDLLGVTLAELRALPPGAFSPDPPDPDNDAAFRAEWEASGRPDIGGQATIQRPNGSQARVRFAITPTGEDRFLAVLEEIAASTTAPTLLYTGGEVMARWRAAERHLDALIPGSDEAVAL
jgi:PAS domain-containing protein